MIVFGHNSFVIKRISPGEVGLFTEEWIGAQIHLRQKYAHLYYIPVFPIGQVWVVRKNKVNYELNDDIKEVLEKKYPHRVHIGAFALFILLAAIGIIFYISETMSTYSYNKHWNQEIKDKAILLNEKLDELTAQNTYLVFEYDDYSDDELVCKVLDRKDDEIYLAFDNRVEEYTQDYSLDLPNKIIRYKQFKENGIDDSVWVSLKSIKATIKNSDSAKGKKIKGLGDAPLVFKRAITIDDAYFIEKTNEEAQSVYYNEYVNYGADIIIDSIVPDNSSEEWKLSVERNIPFMHKFAIKTESQNDAVIYYHTLDGLQRTAIINKKGVVHDVETEDYDYYYY